MLFDTQCPHKFSSPPINKLFDKTPLVERSIITDRQIQLAVPRPEHRPKHTVDDFDTWPPILDLDCCRLPIVPALQVIVDYVQRAQRLVRRRP